MIARITPTPTLGGGAWQESRASRLSCCVTAPPHLGQRPRAEPVLNAAISSSRVGPDPVARPRARRSVSEDPAGVRPRSCALNGFRDSTHVEAVEDDIEPVLELIAVVVAGLHDVLREELDQVRVLVDGERLEHGLGQLPDLL
jgi:hypothetical protein